MTTLARYQFTAVNEQGNILTSASVEVRNEVGNALAALFSDRAGTVAIGNPFIADAITAFAAFHVTGGAYKIIVTKGGFTQTYRYVGIGTASENDASHFFVLGTPIATTPNTLNQGLNITNIGPVSGSNAGPFAFNEINVTYTSDTNGTGIDGTGNANTCANAFRVNMFIGGTDLGGQAIGAGAFCIAHTVSDSVNADDRIGLVGTAYSNKIDLGIHGLFASCFYAALAATGKVGFLVGSEIDMQIDTGGITPYRFGQIIQQQGSTRGSTLDAAIMMSNGGAAGGAFQNLFLFSGFYGGSPVHTTGNIFYNSLPLTVANVFNCSDMTVTGKILDFPFVSISGDGLAGFGTRTPQTILHLNNNSKRDISATGNHEQLLISGTDSNNTGIAIKSFGTGNGQFSQIEFLQAAGTATSRTAVQSGNILSIIGTSPFNGLVYLGFRTQIRSFTTDTVGTGVTPSGVSGMGISLIMTPKGTNSVIESCRTADAGGWDVGLTADTAAGVVNALIGYQINSAAISGRFLVGNGSAHISVAMSGDATLASSGALTLATVNGNVGTFGSATQVAQVTFNAKGLATAAANVTITPAVGSITGLGTGVATALGVSIGSAGAFTTFNGAHGTPSSLVGTNITGTAAGLTAGNVTTNANLTGDVTSVGNVATITALSRFSATKGGTNQTGIVDSTITQVTFSTEDYDIGSRFASDAWTPPAGPIVMSAGYLAVGTITVGNAAVIVIRKNGSDFRKSTFSASTDLVGCQICGIEDVANGTDVYTIWCNIDVTSGTGTIAGQTTNTWFNGHSYK
jgi:hypothetical protein